MAVVEWHDSVSEASGIRWMHPIGKRGGFISIAMLVYWKGYE